MKHLYGLQFAFWWSTIYFEATVVNEHCSIPLLTDPSLCHFHQLHQALLSYRLQNKHLLDVSLFLRNIPSHDDTGDNRNGRLCHWDAIVKLHGLGRIPRVQSCFQSSELWHITSNRLLLMVQPMCRTVNEPDRALWRKGSS